jgi:hypothetical protein
MSWNRFKQQFKYHYKKYIAIFFISLALIFEISSFVYSVVSLAQSGFSIPSLLKALWNFFVLSVCYYLILTGNLKDNNTALQGVISFIFMSLLLDIINGVVDGIFNFSFLISAASSGNWQQMLISLLSLAFLAVSIVFGIFAFIRLKAFLNGRNGGNYHSTILWVCLFMSTIILSIGFSVGFLCLTLGLQSFSVLFSSLSSLGELACAIACVFTILRLRD